MPAEAARKRRPVPSTGFGRVLRRLRWPVLIVWVIAVVLLDPLASSLSSVADGNSSAYLSPSAQSTQVALLQQAARVRAHLPSSNEAIVVFTRPGRLTAADLTAASSARTTVARLLGSASGPEAPGTIQRSADGQAAAFTVTVRSTSQVTAIRQATDTAARDAGNGLQDGVAGSAAENADTGQGSQTRLLLTALVIVVIILFLVYRSPLLWLLPVIGALGAIVIAQAAAHGLVNAGLTVSTLASSILIVLVFGAASDYALLLTHRYRAELRRHATCEDAMAATLRATLPTLAASAATVTGAMLCLLAAESASLHGLGPVGMVSIAAALLAQATFLPALLLVTGRQAFWPRIPRPGDTGREESRLWSGVGSRVARRPALVAIGGVLVLAAACSGLLAFRIDNNPVANLKDTAPSVTAASLVTARFGPGVLDPITLLAPPPEAATAASLTRAMPDVASVTAQAPVGGYAAYSVILSTNPYGTQAAATVKNLRSQLGKAAPGSLVGGNPAISYDFTQEAARDAKLLIPLVLAVIFLVVAVLLQAIVAPLLLVATTALSLAASFGLSSLLWRHALGYSGIEAPIPLYVFIFLVALGIDYGIFLTARIWEEDRASGTTQGILRGLGVTGGVITAAGIVLAGTFLALAQNPQVSIDEVGSAVAIGVLLETLLVRTVVVPATFLMIGEAIWWPAKRSKSMPAEDASDRAAVKGRLSCRVPARLLRYRAWIGIPASGGTDVGSGRSAARLPRGCSRRGPAAEADGGGRRGG